MCGCACGNDCLLLYLRYFSVKLRNTVRILTSDLSILWRFQKSVQGKEYIFKYFLSHLVRFKNILQYLG